MLAAIPAMVLALITWLITTFFRQGGIIFPPEIGRAFRQAEVTLVKWEQVADGALTWWWVPVALAIFFILKRRQ